MEHIERMELELQEIKWKIEKGRAFLNKEMQEAKYTNELQRQLLAIQLTHMENYHNVLLARINNDKNIK